MTNKLTTPEFITILAEELTSTLTADVRVTKKLAGEVKSAYESAIARAIVEKQASVPLGDLGQIKVEVKEAREYRNPQNGETIAKPAQLDAKFKKGSALKQALASTKLN